MHDRPSVPLLSTTLSLLGLLIAAAPAPAQKVCDSENENVAPTFSSAATSWFCIKRAYTMPMVVTAVEYMMRSNGPTSGVNVGVWDEDPATGKPRTLLGSGPVTNLVPNVGGFYGGTLSMPVILTTPGNYFIGLQVIAGVQPSLARTGGVITPHWWNPTAGWSGPHPSGAWGVRVHCGVHAGMYTTYGTAKPGSSSIAPNATGLGFPNTTNPIRLLIDSALGGAQGAFVFGVRATLPTPPFGTLYAAPLIVIPVGFQGMGAGSGYAALDLVVPNNPSLNNQTMAWQGLVIDPGAAAGLAHTQGVEITFGH